MDLENHKCVCKEKCLVDVTNKIFSVFGGKTNYVLNNPGRKVISKYIVDDCLLKQYSDEEKCDYLFVLKEEKIAVFVELKGDGVLKGIKQINRSIDLLNNSLTDFQFIARIVPTKVGIPAAINNSKDYRYLLKRTKGDFVIKNTKLEEDL